jgi:Ca2+-binding RTX toxin-like protein
MLALRLVIDRHAADYGEPFANRALTLGLGPNLALRDQHYIDLASGLELTADNLDLGILDPVTTIFGSIGDDSINATNGDHRLFGDAGADVLVGGDADDFLDGGDGNDVIVWGRGTNVAQGGAGDDLYRYFAGDGDVTIIDTGVGDQIRVTVPGSDYLLGDHPIYAYSSGGFTYYDERGNFYSLTSNDLVIRVEGGAEIRVPAFEGSDFGLAFSGMQSYVPPPGATSFTVDPNEVRDPAADPAYGYYSGTTGWYSAGSYYDTLGNEIITAQAAVAGSGQTEFAPARGGFGDTQLIGDVGFNWLVDDVGWQTSGPYLGTYALDVDVGNDRLEGGGGNDWLVSHGGDDESLGGDGDDVIVDTHAVWDRSPLATGGAPILHGYESTAWVDQPGHSSNDRVLGEAGNDYLIAHGGDQYLDGGSGADELYGGAGSDFLVGGDGDDVLSGDTRLRSGDPEQLAGTPFVRTSILPSGAETYEFNGDFLTGEQTKFGNDFLDGGEGNDTLFGGGGNDTLVGGAGNDRIQGDFLGASIYPDLRPGLLTHASDPLAIQGDDTIDGGAGDDVIFGGAGDDLIDAGADNDTVYGGADDDTIWGGAGIDYLVGDDPTGVQGADEIHGGDGNDQIFGLGGNDRLFGDAGSDQIVGGEGDDLIEGGTDNDFLYGDAGNDILRGGAGQDQLHGGDGDDLLEGGGGDDLLFGGAGNDQFRLSLGDGEVQITDTEGTNRLVLGPGIDRDALSVSISNGLVIIDFSPTDYAFMDVATFETLEGISLSDGTSLSREDTRHLFEPGTVADGTLQLGSGVAATEISYHARNNDLILAYDGGVTNWVDTNTLSSRGVAYETGTGEAYGLPASTRVMALTNWYVATSTGYIREIREVGQSPIDFTFAAYAIPHELVGTAESDLLEGASGVDLITGGDGSDLLSGLDWNDELTGGAGDDLLAGGAGNDTYHIGTGDGADLILEEVGTDDVVRFGPEITTGSLTVTESAAGLEVQIGNPANGDSLLIFNWAQGGAQSIDRFVFEDATSLDRSQIDALNTGNHSPRVGTPISEQVAPAGQAFAFGVPLGTFTDQDAGDTLSYTARQANGAPLPAWVSFDPVTRTFSGTPSSADAGTVSLTLEVVDGGGLYNQLDFDLRVTSAIVLTGTSAANTLTATTADDYEIYGLGGNDTLTGNVGNDRLEGGTGADTLNGAAGNDVYVYARGDGHDVISQNDVGAGKLDTLLLRSGIVAADLVFSSEPDGNLVIRFRNPDGSISATESITVTQGLVAETRERTFDQIVFEDDPSGALTIAAVEALAMTPTENADYFRGSAGADSVDLLGGNDVAFGQGGDDTITGGAGFDELSGGAGADVLIGGADGDTLTGGGGSDIYRMNRGDGIDTITGDLDTDPASIDAVVFGPGVSPSDVKVTRAGSTMTLRINDPATGAIQNLITVTLGFDDVVGSQVIDEVRFDDAPGTVWNRLDLQAQTLIGTDAADTIIGYSTDDILIGNGGFDYLRGAGGNDILIGGAGNDQLNGEAGDDIYRFGHGQGWDEILDFEGSNVLELDAGIAPSSVSLYRTSSLGVLTTSQDTTGSDDLVLVLDNGPEQLRIEGFYSQTPRPITEIRFSGGTVWNAAQIDANTTNFGGTANTQNGNNQGNSFTVDHPNDIINENVGAGIDTVTSTVGYTLPTNVENLTLSGPLNIDGYGNALNNVIHGNEVNNTLQGYGSPDQLYGHGGDDIFTFYSDEVSDLLYGGPGDDTYYVGVEGSSLFGGGPRDSVNELAGEGYDTVYTQSFEYTIPSYVERVIFQPVPGSWTGSVSQWDIIGNAEDNYIDARNADKRLTSNYLLNGGAGADVMYAVTGGLNRIIVDNVGDVVLNADSNDTIVSSVSYALAAGVWSLELTGSGAISGTGNAIANRLNGATSSGANVLTGGAGDDEYTLGLGDTVIEAAGEGIDTILAGFVNGAGNVHDLALHANVERLTVTDVASTATLLGAAGNEILTGNSSANTLDGRAGDDTLIGASGDDTYAGFGATSGHDVIVDTAGADRIELDPTLGLWADQLALSQSGNDLLIGMDAGNSARVQGWYSSPTNRVETLSLTQAGLVYEYTATQIEGRVAGANTGPVLAGALDDATAPLGSTFNLTVPGNLFSDIESQSSLAYAATLADGSALPTWLTFDPGTRSFSGQPGAGDTGSLQVKVTATDAGGLSAYDQFQLDVGFVVRNGTSGDDVVSGDGSNEFIYGLEGDDILSGAAGDDRLIGASGQDRLDGGTGADVLEGGIGNDTYVFDGSSGADQIIEANGFDRIEFANGSGIALSSISAAHVGDDLVLSFGGQSVTVVGHYAANASRVEEFVTFGAGQPTVYSAAQIEALAAGQNSAPHAANAIDDQAARANTTWTFQVPQTTFTEIESGLSYTARQAGGAALPSWLSFNATTRTFSGKPPNGSYTNYVLEVVATDSGGLAATQQFQLFVRPSMTTYTGTSGNDTNSGSSGHNYQLGLAGNDVLDGNAGDDIQQGGDGADTLNGGDGYDNIYGGAGDDYLNAGTGAGNDNLYGGAGRDTLVSASGNLNNLYGGDGDDLLIAGAGIDTLVGGDGVDTYQFSPGFGGLDVIDTTARDGEGDRAVFLSTTRSQLSFTRVGNSLRIARSGDAVTVNAWFDAPTRRLATVETSDGIITTADEIDALIGGGGSMFSSAVTQGATQQGVEPEAATKEILAADSGSSPVDGGEPLAAKLSSYGEPTRSATKSLGGTASDITPVYGSFDVRGALDSAISAFLDSETADKITVVQSSEGSVSKSITPSDMTWFQQIQQLTAAMAGFKDFGAAEIGDSISDPAERSHHTSFYGPSSARRHVR